jgi:dolichyl-phosphate beta-glucosyltransferase
MQKTAIIIPCYNEQARLNMECIVQFLSTRGNMMAVFVNDGSDDQTSQVIEEIRSQLPAQVRMVKHEKRKGKAEAVRSGLIESMKDPEVTIHGYLDADLAVSLEEFERLSNLMAGSGKTFILGSRIKKVGSRISRNEFRHFYSRFIATLVGYITKLDVYDTQCSAKMFRTSIIPVITREPFRTRWLFDVELIDRIRKHVGELNDHGHEEPLLAWDEKKGSKLRWFNFFSIMRELFILRKYHRKE